jgi:hypothetical protein
MTVTFSGRRLRVGLLAASVGMLFGLVLMSLTPLGGLLIALLNLATGLAAFVLLRGETVTLGPEELVHQSGRRRAAVRWEDVTRVRRNAFGLLRVEAGRRVIVLPADPVELTRDEYVAEIERRAG